MHDLHDDQAPTLDEAFDAAECFARTLFRAHETHEDLRAQLADAERVLSLIKGAETIESARMWARSYFGEAPF
jgi:hypothetical protein